MDPSLRTAATGMMAQQTRTEVIANNLANVNTTGFKRSRAHFEDLLYQTVQGASMIGAQDAGSLPAIQIGRGVRPVEGEMVVERLGVARVQRHGAQVARSMGLDHGFRRGGVHIAQGDVVIAGFGQQAADEGADLAGTQDQDFVHENLVGP